MNYENVDSIFKLSLRELEDSDYRFFINRARSVVIMNGTEFNDDEIPDCTDIYIMYNDPDRPPVLIAMTSDSVTPIKKFGHDGYNISYKTQDNAVVTYLRVDALTLLDEEDLKAVEDFSKE